MVISPNQEEGLNWQVGLIEDLAYYSVWVNCFFPLSCPLFLSLGDKHIILTVKIFTEVRLLLSSSK